MSEAEVIEAAPATDAAADATAEGIPVNNALSDLSNPDWWMSIEWIEIASDVGVWLAIVICAWVIGGIIGGTVRRSIDLSKRAPSAIFKNFAVTWARRVIVILGMVIAFGTVGVDIAPIIAGLGVFGFVIGFAVQGTLSNFASGIMLLIYQPFDEGDLIETNGVLGVVSHLSVVSTTVLTLDNREVIIPNSSVWGAVIVNITRQPTRRIDLVIGVGYGADLKITKSLLTEFVQADEGVLADPAVQVEVFELGDSSVNFVVRPWVKTDDYWDVHFRLMAGIKDLLDANDIEIPFPQRVVHMNP